MIPNAVGLDIGKEGIFGSEEKMGTNFYVGALIIMDAVVLYPVFKKRHDRTVVINV